MRYIFALLAVIMMMPASYAAQEIEEAGSVTAVTLYRGQALVTRLISVVAQAGAVQLTVKDLPQAVVGESLFVNADRNIQVRAVRFHTQAVGEAPEKEVKELDDSIAALEKTLRENRNSQSLVVQKQSYLDKLGAFVTPSASVEMSKGVLNADTLASVTRMIFEQRTALSHELLKLSELEKELRQELALKQRKRNELARSHSKTLREAIIFLDKADDAGSQVRLGYLVRNASWSPIYNVRGGGTLKHVTIEVGALVQQTSGEDWEGVDLTLSTAGAQLVADGPTLAPLKLHLSDTVQGSDVGVSSLEKKLKSAKERLRGNKIAQRGVVSRSSQLGIQWEMNVAVQDMQQIELAADAKDLKVLRRSFREKTSSLAASYPIEGKVSLASRHDNQMVQIDRLTLPASYFYEAIPLLTEEVHRYAELTNDSDISLLEGNASVYLDNEFVGTAVLPLVARGQKVTVGFGTDAQLHTSREFVSKQSRGQLLGKKKEVTYKYRLVLENYSDEEVSMRVLDRIPMATDDISVALGQLEDSLSTDMHYARVHRPQGILRWDVRVPAKSARESARTVEYSFELKFDAKLSIVPGAPKAPAAAQQIEFEELMGERMYMH